MKKMKILGHQSRNREYIYILFLLSVITMTSCKCNKYMINSDEVESVQFWYVHPTDLYNISQRDCADMVFADDNQDTIITDIKVIKQYIKIINSLRPIDPKLCYDLRATSLIRMKKIDDKKKPNIKACIDPVWGRVLLNDVLTQGNKRKIYNFLNEVLYKHTTQYDWLPNVIKQYIKENPEERSKFLPE